MGKREQGEKIDEENRHKIWKKTVCDEFWIDQGLEQLIVNLL